MHPCADVVAAYCSSMRLAALSHWRLAALVTGLFACSEIELQCNSTEDIREDIRKFLSDDTWQFPAAGRVKAKQLHRIFDPRRILAEKPDKLKGNCSEFLGLFGLLRHWVDVESPKEPELEAKRKSFDKLCEVLDMILNAKRGLVSPADGSRALAVACSDFLRLHKVCTLVWAAR